MKSKVPRTVDEYIETFPKDVQKRLQELRRLVRRLAPEADEKISYRMPSFHLKKNLVYFAAFANHIGLYPGVGVVARFKQKLSKYKNAKGSVQFPHQQPLPLDLIEDMVKDKLAEIGAKQNRSLPAR
jgi:uncharacterized protein YdhG (YjbR/CyaY superfamily)